MVESPLSEHIPKESVAEVKISGDWKIYGLMSQKFNTPYPKGKYLGTSKEIRISDVALNLLDVEYHFWMKAEYYLGN
jgi:hypothetical protein